MSSSATYHPTDPLAASIGAEREEYYELYVWIDDDVETTYLIPKPDLPTPFRKYGLAVWLTDDGSGKVYFEHRTTKVAGEIRYAEEHDAEFGELVRRFESDEY